MIKVLAVEAFVRQQRGTEWYRASVGYWDWIWVHPSLELNELLVNTDSMQALGPPTGSMSLVAIWRTRAVYCAAFLYPGSWNQ